MSHPKDLAGRTAIVTGAAGNIGRAIALALAEAGANVMVTARANTEGIGETVGLIGSAGGVAAMTLADVTDESSIEALMAHTARTFGAIDILINNAAIRVEAPLAEITLADFRKVTSVALEGPFLCARAALPWLVDSPAACIINIGGLTAYTGAANRAHVVAAKAGLDGLTKALAHELAPVGITVNLVSPGLIGTVRGGASSPQAPAHHQRHATLSGHRGLPSDVAAMVRFLAGPGARFVTGQTMHVNGGAYLP